MTDSNGDHDRLIAEAAARAASQVEQEAQLGEHLWTDASGGRCFLQRFDNGFELTILRPGTDPYVHRIDGVDVDRLT